MANPDHYGRGAGVAGPALKETGTVYWDADPGSTNSTGFSARGGGFRDNNSGNFYYLRTFSYFWDATAQSGGTAYFHGPFSSGAYIISNAYPYKCGFSVRLIKDGMNVRPKAWIFQCNLCFDIFCVA